MLQRFGPIMNKGGACISLTYLASEKIIPGYGGGMSSAKAALESDTQVLAYEAGRKWGIRVNTISAGPLGSRAAKAIGFIDDMINYSMSNAPLNEKPLTRDGDWPDRRVPVLAARVRDHRVDACTSTTG